MTDFLTTTLTALISGAIGAFFTAVLFRSQIRQELQVEYDKDLRKLRLAAYARLYGKFVVIAPYSREKDPSYEDLRGLAAEMRDWYFGRGGLCLSERSRPAYFELKKLLDELVTANVPERDRLVPAEELKKVVQAASKVRATLAEDVGSRKGPLLADN